MTARSLQGKCKSSQLLKAKRQKLSYDRKANAISLEPGDLVLAKADCLQVEEESEGMVVRGTIRSGVPGCRGHHFVPHDE